MADVFISYARSERAEAECIKDLLVGLSLTVFFDVEGLDGGDVFPDVLDREVKSSGVVLGLWSPHALTRPWIKTECSIGQKRKVLVPAAVRPIGEMDIPAAFWDMQYIDLTEFSGDARNPNWIKLVKAIGRTLKRDDLLTYEPRERPATPSDPILNREVDVLRQQLRAQAEAAERQRAELDAIRTEVEAGRKQAEERERVEAEERARRQAVERSRREAEEARAAKREADTLHQQQLEKRLAEQRDAAEAARREQEALRAKLAEAETARADALKRAEALRREQAARAAQPAPMPAPAAQPKPAPAPQPKPAPKPEQKQSNAGVVIFLLIAAAVGGAAWLASHQSPLATTPAEMTTTTDASMAPMAASPMTSTDPAVEEKVAVQRLQEALVNKGYDAGYADGVIGSQTWAALDEFLGAQDVPAVKYSFATTEEISMLAAQVEAWPQPQGFSNGFDITKGSRWCGVAVQNTHTMSLLAISLRPDGHFDIQANGGSQANSAGNWSSPTGGDLTLTFTVAYDYVKANTTLSFYGKTFLPAPPSPTAMSAGPTYAGRLDSTTQEDTPGVFKMYAC